MTESVGDEDRSPIGHLWLRSHFGLRVPRPYVRSYSASGPRRTVVNGPRTEHVYNRAVLAEPNDIRSHLRFALKHEPLDLRIIAGTCKVIDPKVIRRWVLDEPTGSYSRRAWFFYEWATGTRLDLDDVRSGPYVDALDAARHVVAPRKNSPRHRVVDNLLGNRNFCPTVRRTSRLCEQMGMHVDEEARELIASYDGATLARAINYLYTKETRSSFAIESEIPSPNKTALFIAALRSADRFDPYGPKPVIHLQNQIVDPRYAANKWRDFQNFVGESVGFREQVHFICPRPSDVTDLMNGWGRMTQRITSSIDPVVAAAISGFGFVFIHPFEDGNGRIHRYIIHHILAKTGFSPPQVIFPVSAAIARDQRAYDEVLAGFSSRIAKYIDWHWEPGRIVGEQEIAVENDTADLYRYFDATLFAEYLYDRVADTVRVDLREELQFVSMFDAALERVNTVVDIPNRRASLLVRLFLQNGGRLSRRKRDDFAELTDVEVLRMEDLIRALIAEQADENTLPGLFS